MSSRAKSREPVALERNPMKGGSYSRLSLMRIVIILIIIAVSTVGAIYSAVQRTAAPRVLSLHSVQPHPVGLVLGASIKGGAPNRVLQERLDTALILYQEGKVKKLMLSGDNRTVDHNEPEAMKHYLLERGVPEKDLILDYAGRRTYDSCYRMKEVFGIESLIIITQDFHLPRALYLCNSLGVDAVGIAADTNYPVQWLESYFREVPATIQAWLDIVFIKPTPVLGNPEKVF